MPVPSEPLAEGRCYLTNAGQVRRITRIFPDGRVQFQTRAYSQSGAAIWKTGMVHGRSFSSMVEREVPCNWTAETDE